MTTPRGFGNDIRQSLLCRSCCCLLPFVAAGGGNVVALSELQRQIAWALHSGTVVALLDACRISDEIFVTPSAPIGELCL